MAYITIKNVAGMKRAQSDYSDNWFLITNINTSNHNNILRLRYGTIQVLEGGLMSESEWTNVIFGYIFFIAIVASLI